MPFFLAKIIQLFLSLANVGVKNQYKR